MITAKEFVKEKYAEHAEDDFWNDETIAAALDEYHEARCKECNKS